MKNLLEDYIPYSKEWEEEVMKLQKKDIVTMFRKLGMERDYFKNYTEILLAKQTPPEPC